jgi:hypothetical protein
MHGEPDQPEATMPSQTATLQTYTLSEGQSVATTYTRVDLGIDTAVIASTPDGRWVARLCYGPEPDESTSETVELEGTADRLAIEHSLGF